MPIEFQQEARRRLGVRAEPVGQTHDLQAFRRKWGDGVDVGVSGRAPHPRARLVEFRAEAVVLAVKLGEPPVHAVARPFSITPSA